MKTVPSVGLAEVAPQFDPPWFPGISTVSVIPGGVKIPSLRALASRSFNEACSSALNSHGLTSSGPNFCLANGGTTVGNDCVGQDFSPGILVCGTLRSSMGHNGL